jgi:hypothetical protein
MDAADPAEDAAGLAVVVAASPEVDAESLAMDEASLAVAEDVARVPRLVPLKSSQQQKRRPLLRSAT